MNSKFLIFWIGSTAISFGTDFVNVFHLFKDAADQGYKVNPDKIKSLSQFINKDNTRIHNLIKFIPGFNLVKSLADTAAITTNKEEILSTLYSMGAIEDMEEYEKDEYLKKPTGFNALVVAFRGEDLLNKYEKIVSRDKDGYSEIYYKTGKDLDDIKIYKTTGKYASMSKIEVKEVIKEKLDSITEHLDKVYVQYDDGKMVSFDEFVSKIASKDMDLKNLDPNNMSVLINNKEGLDTNKERDSKTL